MLSARHLRQFMPKNVVEPQQDDWIQSLNKQDLQQLRIGWNIDETWNRRRVTILEKALLANRSLRKVSIGWRLDAPTVVAILKSIRHLPLESLKLILDHPIPESVLKTLLQSQTLLQVLDLRGISVTRRHSLIRNRQDTSLMDTNVVSRIFGRGNFSLMHPHLTELYLVDCGLTDRTAELLADYMHLRGGLQELSVRSNRALGCKGVQLLVQAPISRKLDLSLCDLGPIEVEALANALQNRQWPLHHLLLCGNYRLDIEGVVAMTQPETLAKLVHLDMSFCDLGDYKTTVLFEALIKARSPTLQHVTLQGCRLLSNDVVDCLCRLLRANTNIRFLTLDNPASPSGMSLAQLQKVTGCLRDNFHVEELRLDRVRHHEEAYCWQQVAFYIRLNQAGRRVLLGGSRADWVKALSRSNHDMELSYWMVLNSAAHF